MTAAVMCFVPSDVVLLKQLNGRWQRCLLLGDEHSSPVLQRANHLLCPTEVQVQALLAEQQLGTAGPAGQDALLFRHKQTAARIKALKSKARRHAPACILRVTPGHGRKQHRPTVLLALACVWASGLSCHMPYQSGGLPMVQDCWRRLSRAERRRLGGRRAAVRRCGRV